MLCREIMAVLEGAYPCGCALEWDNVGLLAGRADKEVGCIYTAVDVTDEVIDEALSEGADMLVTHHPLIFSGLKKVTDQDFIGRRVLKLLKNDISYYAVHTNYDIKRMAELSAQRMNMEGAEVLEAAGVNELGEEEGIGRIADIRQTSVSELCGQVKAAFGLASVRVFGDPDKVIKRAAICPGSGKSVIDTALKKGADVLITGDIGHHEGIDAEAQNLTVIDAGHYGLEHIFIEDMKCFLEENIRAVRIEAAPVSHPFTVL